ncbi:MAG: DUF87 domain-containing protein [Patescibacteria group bacterium]
MFNLIFYLFGILILTLISAIIAWFFIFRLGARSKLHNALNLILYEITFPQEGGKEDKKDFKELIAAMEQFYTGMTTAGQYFVLEIGLPFTGDEIVFYTAVDRNNSQIFEKQIHGFFPDVKVIVKKEDYNIFKPQGYSLGSVAQFKKDDFLPIKTYDKFETDPLQVIINTFSKLKTEGEGASLQIIVSASKRLHTEHVKKVASRMKEGEKFYEAIKPKGFGEALVKEGKGWVSSPDMKKDTKQESSKTVDEEIVKLLESKSSRQIMSANIRLLVSAENRQRAQSILSELESAFLQFNEPHGNDFWFKRLSGKKLKNLFYEFSFRIINKKDAIHLNVAELASVFHFPLEFGSSVAPQLKYVKTKESAPPLNLPSSGLLIGRNIYRGEEKKIYIKDDDRRRHFYVIGQTGTGKSAMLKNMAVQDIENGKGICFIDPHGSDLQDILARIPQERIEDVIYFDPSEISRPMGLNILEYNANYPEQKTFIAHELYGIFRKIWKDIPEAFGPMFEQYYQNSVLLVMEDPVSGNTLLEIPRVLSDKNFRDHKLSRCRNPVVVAFWRNVAEKASGEAGLQNIAPYITSKFDTFLTNEIMRPIIAQEKSAFNFREIMDEGRILLINLSKGRLGDINSKLIGLIMVGKLLMASLSRVDIPEESRKDFYLYIDEFQNITTDSISTILSEARKYRLNLAIAHQFIGQLDENIKKSVFGNVGSIACFRIGSEDAEFVEKQFAPIFNAQDLINLDNYNAYLKILIDGQTSRPFNIKTLPFQKGNSALAEKIIGISSLKYGRPRLEIEEDINRRYQ